ncbi:MAG: ClpP family protease [Planctomycetota bacterium]
MAEEGNDRPHRLFDRLLEKRTILLSEPVMPESTERVVAQLLYLDAEDGKKPIRFFLNCPGGSITDGFAIFDTVRMIRAPVTTLCTGLAASMGTILMMSPTDKKRRLTLPNARFMIHQPSSTYRGVASDVEIGAREILKMRDRLIQVYVDECGHSADKVKADINRDFWMTAEEAVDYGITDRVVRHAGDVD